MIPTAPLDKQYVQRVVTYNKRLSYYVKVTLDELLDLAHNEEYSYGEDAFQSFACDEMIESGYLLKDIALKLEGISGNEIVILVTADATDVLEDYDSED